MPNQYASTEEIPEILQAARWSGFDEMIQLVHVLRGEMLLTGGYRPLVESGDVKTHHSVEMMEDSLPRSLYREWLGVCGFWQAVAGAMGHLEKVHV